MAQVLEFKLPDLGEGLTEAEIVRWLVQVGDVVTVDQPVVEVETAKAMVEVPCPYGGVVTARFGEEGTELPVGAPLLTVAVGAAASGGPATGSGEGSREDARVGSGDGTRGGASQGAGLGTSERAPAGSEGSRGGSGTRPHEGSGNVLVGYGTGAAPARRRRVRPTARTAPTDPTARTAPTDPTARTAAGAASPIPDAPDIAHATPDIAPDSGNGYPADGPVPVISPLVRRLARENGLDLRELTGSGPDGLILRADVEYALRAAAASSARPSPRASMPSATTPSSAAPTAAAPSAPTESPLAPVTPLAPTPAESLVARVTHAPAGAPVTSAPGGTRIPLKGIRGAVADKLSRSRREIPDATCWVDTDATELMRAREAMNGAGRTKISLLALLARICTAALARFPELNSTVDLEAREVVQLDRVHLGFAAQTERGLVVPVVRDAHARDAESLTAEFARLTEAARTGTLTPAELTGGTFTLNNYGVFGVDGSTPIINHPEAAMLGVGRIVPKPWVHQGELAVRQVVQLSLTFDHRVCDGGTAGGFLRHVADCVEQPAVLLRTM
ncbi:dihydrolipoamide acetyltransferase family protein [Streptomyces sp. DG2A-72]|uniref:dihydrolipoamide acetyltransferase family protein n=1 Tax=Streptomyces sp. DG2A-72 TaxID=3051386 RepID=UPI00265C8B57|nr:dihydrolipoamide acetyltransferase family protein [Streptomyces sp. DG2A-72]MDO0934691.1 dihydrolipoamide acetyltransferase family protein [Streptomyces sp. DG2A-72]